MAKVAKAHAIRILISKEWWDRPEVQRLIEDGHQVDRLTDLDNYDLILHRCSVNWDETLWPHIDIAIKAARKRRKDKGGTVGDSKPA